jgi:asparagine synthetase A
MKELFTAYINAAMPYTIGGGIGFAAGLVIGWLL